MILPLWSFKVFITFFFYYKNITLPLDIRFIVATIYFTIIVICLKKFYLRYNSNNINSDKAWGSTVIEFFFFTFG